MPYFHVGQKVHFEDEDMTTHRGFIVMSRPDHAGDVTAFEDKFIWVVERENNQQLYGLCINEKPRKILRFKVGDKVRVTKPDAAAHSVSPGEYEIAKVVGENDNEGEFTYHDYRLVKPDYNINDDDLTYA